MEPSSTAPFGTAASCSNPKKIIFIIMKRKKVALQARGNCDLYVGGIMRVSKEENVYFFEIGNETTCDVAEAVAIMMRKVDWQDPVWDIEYVTSSVDPEKALFWLTGGYTEWRTLENFNRPWCDCYLEYQQEFGELIFNISTRNTTLRGIREGFVEHVSLPDLYEFALSRDFIK